MAFEDMNLMPKDADPCFKLPCIYPKDKFDRGVGLNPSEESEFRCICSLGTSQLINCYRFVDERFTKYDFMMSCYKCKYYSRERIFDTFKLVDSKSRDIWHPDWLAKYMEDNHLFPDSENIVFVYFISDKRSVKIGKAIDINKRMLELQTGNSEKLDLLFAIGCKDETAAYDVEGLLHARLRNYHKTGEWFDILDKLYLSVWQTMFYKPDYFNEEVQQ